MALALRIGLSFMSLFWDVLVNDSWACSVCAGQGFPRRTLDAYFLVTVLLSVLPLVMCGLAFWIYRKFGRGGDG